MIEPSECRTMAEVRVGVDAVDRALATLLTRRFAYMDAAARIKTQRVTVRDEARKAEVLANARANASGYSPELAEGLWELLVEASIAYELDRFDGRGV